MTVLSGETIHKRVLNPKDPFVITPFLKAVKNKGVLSYGLSCAGYDLSLSLDGICIDKSETQSYDLSIDPKAGKSFMEVSWVKVLPEPKLVPMSNRPNGHMECHVYTIPPKTSFLGSSLEYIEMPNDLMGTCFDKSTYARIGLISNITPIEPGWKGYLTMEFYNQRNTPIEVYAEEGIIQIVFHTIDTPSEIMYNGKYQGQGKGVTHAIVE